MDTRALKTVWADQFLDWQLGDEHPVNPMRAYVAAEALRSMPGFNVEMMETWAAAGDVTRERWLEAAERIQPAARKMVEARPELLWMFGGTFVLTEELISDRAFKKEANLYFNPAGGELSGQHQDVEVLNDLAYAAVRLRGAGLRVAVVSLDAHHANQTESLLRGMDDVPTFSVHQASSAATTYSTESFINYGLAAGSGDEELLSAVDDICDSLREMDLDVVLMDIGCDGLADDPSSQLAYTEEGLGLAGIRVAQVAAAKDASMLVGGGGGELSLEETPSVWATSVVLMTSTMGLEKLAQKNLARSVDNISEPL